MIDLEFDRSTLRAMISLYCRQKHKTEDLCQECAALWDYAEERLEKCPFGANKPTCQNCPVHCYKPEMRQRVREVMRWAGPRMLWRHPVMAIRHLIHNAKKPS